MAARGWRATRAFAGRWKKWARLYEVRLVSFKAMQEAAHLALHPFGQIPAYEEGDLGLFETRGDRVPHRAAPRGPVAD